MIQTWPRVRQYVQAALLIGAVLLVFSPAGSGGFIWDDDDYVTKNPLLTAPDGFQRIWFSFDAPSQYFPLVYTLFRLERDLWGLHPAGYHWVNIFLHAMNALLLWRLLRKLRTPGSFLAAVLFALHPVQVESVAWVTELKNVLMGFFFLLSLLLWSDFIKNSDRNWWHYGLALLAYFLALAAKTTACTLPAAMILILWLHKSPVTRRRLWEIFPFVASGFAMGLVSLFWERYHQGTRGEMFDLGLVERSLVASRAVWFYLSKLFWPADLTFIYPHWTISALSPNDYLWTVACLLFGAVVLLVRRKVGRSLEVAALFFVATLGPMLGFVMLYTFRYTYVADHYQYLACIGPIALVSAGAARLANDGGFARSLVRVGAASIVGLLGFLTWRQATIYHDPETLWRSTIARNPESWMAYNNLGVLLAARGEFEQAIECYRRSLDRHVETKAIQNFADAHYNLAAVLLDKGENDQALTEASIAVRLQPNDSDAHVVLGNALLAAGQTDESITEYERALELKPESADAHYNLGRALQEKGGAASAADHYRAALQIAPETMEAHLNLGNILLQEGHEDGAVRQYRGALAVSPHSVKALNNLAWALATASDRSQRDGAEAVRLAEQANSSLGGADPIVLHTLGAAYAEMGQFEKATEADRQALELAVRKENAPLADEIHRTAQLYSQRLPYQKP